MRFYETIKAIMNKKNLGEVADDLMPSVVQLRIMKCAAYLMALAAAVVKSEDAK